MDLENFDSNALEFIVYDTANCDRNDSALERILRRADELVAGKMPGYIWERDKFTLNKWLIGDMYCLYGTLNSFNVGVDEDAVIYVLHELSVLAGPSVYIRISDASSPETVLAICGDAVPAWLNSPVSVNRVWINEGMVRILELKRNEELSLQEAMVSIRASEMVEYKSLTRTFQDSIVKLQKHVLHNINRCRVNLPRACAALLHEYPEYVSKFASTFASSLESGIMDSKVPSCMGENVSKDIVSSVVSFTNLAYVQLTYSQHQEGQDVTTALSENLFTGMCLFMEIFEEEDSEFERTEYVKGLAENGFFQGEIPGSERYMELMKLAVDAFQPSDGYYVHSRLEQVVTRLPTDEDIKNWPSETDPEDWLPKLLDDESYQVEELVETMHQAFENESTFNLGQLEEEELSGESEQDKDSLNEDDFFEFVLKEGLKLSASEIETFRATEDKPAKVWEADYDDDAEEDDK